MSPHTASGVCDGDLSAAATASRRRVVRFIAFVDEAEIISQQAIEMHAAIQWDSMASHLTVRGEGGFMSQRIGDVFLEGTKYQNLGPSDQKQGVTQPPLHSLLRDGVRIPLPSPQSLDLASMELRDAIEARRSLRTYAEVPLALEELSFLLWCSQGVKPESTNKFTLRTVPSAGARHAFETLLLVNRVDGLDPGLYQFDAAAHRLIQWESPPDLSEQLAAACLNQPMIANSAVTFVWAAERVRMAWRYGERGLRYLFLDAGHVCQNLHLAAESVAAGACAIGAFNDDELNQVLELDGADRFVVYLAAVGKRQA